VPMTQGFVATPECAECGRQTSRVELVAPGEYPAEWAQWDVDRKESFLRRREPGEWWLLFEGVDTGNGGGDSVTAESAALLADAFAAPYRYERVHTAGFYDDAGFCGTCDAPFGRFRWNVSSSGYGHCPQGHGKSLDPHWSP
jgi:hypothetical protein